LGSVKDKDLKEVLMNINHGIQRSVDFRNEYGDEWQRHLRRRRTIMAFEMNSQNISKLESTKSDFDEIGHQLSSLIDKIGPTIEYHNTNSPQIKEKFQEKISTHKSELGPIRKKEEELVSEISKVQSEISILGHEISELKKTEKWILTNSEKDLSDSLTVSLESFSELKMAISKSEQEHYTVAYINTKLQQNRTKIASNRRLLDKQKGTILHSMSEKQIAYDTIAMRLFNEKILSASGYVENPDTFSTLLTEIENGIIDTSLNFRGLSIDDLEQLSSEISLDPKQLEKECEIIQLDITELEKHLEIAKDIEKSRLKLTEIESRIAKLQNEIQRFEKWENEESQQLPMKRNMVKEKSDSKTQLSVLKDNISLEKDAKLKMLEAIGYELNQYERKLEEYNDSWKIIHDAFCPETAFRADENFELTQLSDTLSKCSKLLTRYQKLDTAKSRIQNELYRELSELIHSSSHEQFITNILEINAKLPEQKENAQKEWVHLISNIGRSASLMKESLRVLNQEINSINKICGRIKFSNLDEFHVDFREQSSDIELMSSLTSFSEYSNDPETLQAIENLGEKCMYKQSIVLDELFSLEFKIRRKGANKPDIVRTIDDAGSTGTVVLIKAVLLMILLHKRTMNKKQRMPIPFFLDEVGVFGSNNRGQIVDIGKSLNFQLFTASPESMEEADVVYAILGSGPEDRIYVDPTHKRPKPKTIIGEEE
jgi:chromosome segregation ATPase